MRIALPPRIDPAAFARRDPGAAIGMLAGETMGTSWQVHFVPPAGIDLDALDVRIRARLDRIVGEMSHWDAGSVLSRFNAAADGTWMTLPPDFATVIEAGLAIAVQSGGTFDPAIGRLVDLWGFGPAGPTAPPGPHLLATARAMSGAHRLTFDPAARRLRQPGGLALDLSGIAKGFAVDAVADLLAALGVQEMLVEIGGELAGRGIRPDGEPWWVDLERPPGGGALPAMRIALHGLAVATSGNYRRGDHNIDPRTGRPCRNGVLSVSVIAGAAMAADAWASALTVLGPTEGMTVASDRRIAARIVWRTGDGVREALTPALAAMIDG